MKNLLSTVITCSALAYLLTGTVSADPAWEPDEDTDGDQLLDSWEIRYFGNLRDQSAQDDPDGDGATNLSEMQASTDPTRLDN